ncbi:MAG TPA: tRNA pseudouridine(38-40) synthase TruA [Acidimicrobiia bacterium]|nr:tRNA pseudouridine(38-40) synthase TruA [Acidimicrobiia bacterium]
MAVYRLDVAYDGSGFRGYAFQTGQRTVQGELEEALITYLKTSVVTSVAGRTDAGVHARGQVVSFSYDGEVDLQRLRQGLDGILGPEVSIHRASLVSDDFDARFSATWRRYRYLLDTGPAADPLTRGFVWHVGRELDVPAMDLARKAFVGEHDFSSFCRSAERRINVRRVTELTLVDEDPLLAVWVQANAFCHQMVRSIVGHLYDVGRGFSAASDTPDVIAARDRSRVATVAPPHGLTLWEVGYPRTFGYPRT